MNTIAGHVPTSEWFRSVIVGPVLSVLLLTWGAESWMGRSLLGPDGAFALWEGNIWSSECSQRFADPYSFSHIIHGILFYGLLWLVARNLPIPSRFVIAVILEASWEILENSPMIINRYREATIALGYDGDSVVNSLSDILMMAAGFLFAYNLRPGASVALIVALEIGCLLLIRDNFTLNLIMLVYPAQAIKVWQAAGHPL